MPRARHNTPLVWGATPAEVDAHHRGEKFVQPGSTRAVRAVDVDADHETVFLWLCQLRRAPYSYDLVDNLGRRSPRKPDPAMRNLELGQTFMMGFRLVDFEPGRSLTLMPKAGGATRLMGAQVLTYEARTAQDGRTRLVCVLEIPPKRGIARSARLQALLWGDLVMMRKQLRTLASLAERA
ncbi:hypothetical protein [Aeromicrobium sp.]|uniref:hypothetical protein n=1 Tax=Aeromicrobium sp. TaxID=1871063 RepID=UPI0019A63E78|nr:hypothetical protein [Aeromicrobium sp.]MBC7633438.1 hypothetical protein [Aeromicrobium sp.]